MAHLTRFLFDGFPIVGEGGLGVSTGGALAEGVLEGVGLGGEDGGVGVKGIVLTGDVGRWVGGVDDEVAIEVVLGWNEDGLTVYAVELEIGLVQGCKVGARLELFE